MATTDHPKLTIDVTEDDHDAYVSIIHGFFHGWVGNDAYSPIPGKKFYDTAHQSAHAEAVKARQEVDCSKAGGITSVIFTWDDGPRYELA